MKRTGFIGGSDLGSIVNAPPYGCARKLWYQKRAVEPDYDVPFRGHLLRGVKLEPLIVAEYVAKTGNKVRRRKASRGIAGHEMGAMDRVILGDARGPGVLECKSANERAFREMQKSGIPLGYQLQIQWYMGLSEYRWGAFAILEPSNWRFETFEVDFDPAAFSLMREYVDRFWAMVQGDGEPDRLPASDSRCSKCEYRFSCQGEALLGSIDPDAEASEIPGIAALAAEYLSLRDVRDDAEAAMEQIKEESLRLLGDAASATAPGYRIVAKPQVSQRVDTNALKSKHPDVYQSVLKPSVSRPFRVLPA
jgi:predicted phage-related endonuclease